MKNVVKRSPPGRRIAPARCIALNLRATEIASAEKSLLARIRDDAARLVMKAHPVQRRIEEFFIARFKAHQLIGRFSNESLRVTAMHGRLKKEDIVHGMIPSGGFAIAV